MQPSFANLREVRERLLGYRLESVARLTGIEEARLSQIEREHGSMTVCEAELLAGVYGLDPDVLWESPVRLAAGDAVAVLRSSEEFKETTDAVRARIVAAANAARDCARLRQLIGAAQPDALPDLRRIDKSKQPFQQGKALAAKLRRSWSLGGRPIESLRDLLKDRLPAVVVLFARLGASGPAGLTFADRVRGRTIVLNADGKNENPLVRRFSLAHEVCHVLADWNRAEPLAVLSGYLNESSLEREQRANAFAVRFLCPESALDTHSKKSPVDAARRVLAYGLPYQAVRLYLRNQGGIALPATPPLELGMLGTEARWSSRESPDGIDGFPLASVPLERRTAVALAAATAYSLGKIGRDALAQALGVAPAEAVERVLDYFAINQPSDADAAA